MRFAPLLLLGLIVTFLSVETGLASDESSSRWRARTSSIGDSNYSESDIGDEVMFGREIAARVLGKYKLSENAKLQKYANLVGTALAQNSSRPELEFHFAVIESSEINAYSTPGGYVFITTAALARMDNEAEFAGVLAHEIAHVTNRHIVKELNLRGKDNSAISSVAALIGGASESAGVAFSQAVDKAVDMIFRDGYRKSDEMQADGDAVLLCAFAGYDTAGLVTFLDKVGKIKTGVGKTYPQYDVRLATLNKTAADEGITSMKLKVNSERFAKTMGRSK
jgi:predicted Zn-dependent protease